MPMLAVARPRTRRAPAFFLHRKSIALKIQVQVAGAANTSNPLLACGNPGISRFLQLSVLPRKQDLECSMQFV